MIEIPFGTYPSSFQEIFYWRWHTVVFLWFDFYNGAMTTHQCNRLSGVLKELERDKTINVLGMTIIVIMYLPYHDHWPSNMQMYVCSIDGRG